MAIQKSWMIVKLSEDDAAPRLDAIEIMRQAERNVVPEPRRGIPVMTVPLRQNIRPTQVYLSKELAVQDITHLATSQPGTTYGLFELTSIYDAPKPTVVQKTFTEKGELHPV